MQGQSTFNAKAFEELIQEILSDHMIINDRLDKISGHCDWASTTYRSEDSSLASSYENLVQTLNKAREKADTLLVKLEEELKNYMVDTLANEVATQNELNSVNEILNSASGAIDAL